MRVCRNGRVSHCLEVSVRQHLTCRGFTLIELLVVISIIALLIGILVPALSSARGAARRIKCQTQVRSIGTGVANYSLSYKDLVPHMSDLRSTSLNTVGTGQFYVWYGDKNGAIGALLDNEYEVILREDIAHLTSSVFTSGTIKREVHIVKTKSGGTIPLFIFEVKKPKANLYFLSAGC